MPRSIADHRIEMRHVDKNAGAAFDLAFTDLALTELAHRLGLLGLKKPVFRGELSPAGKGDWQLRADLAATVVQPCVVSHAPVTTRIETNVARLYRAKLVAVEGGAEMEMPEDDSEEQLPATLDLLHVFAEALSLALPDYPRADNLDTFQADYAAPGVDPLSDETVKPFAALAALKDKLS